MNSLASCSVTTGPIDPYVGNWSDPDDPIGWSCLFVSPAWLQAWWQGFGPKEHLRVLTVRQSNETVGVAPIMVEGGTAKFIGSADVCDYLDFAVAPGKETLFFEALALHLREQGVKHLDLYPLHPSSTVCRKLDPLAGSLDCEVRWEDDEAVFEASLPSTWEEYLGGFTGKQRHEVRRKLRRLYDAGRIGYRVVTGEDEVVEGMGAFHSLFRSNREDKSVFMTERMASYFNALAASLARAGILRLSFLDVDGVTTAAAMCFDYRDTIYLYNNGYDDRFGPLSVGMLSKVLSIRDSIRLGRRTYSFLKGDEPYKKRLGGKRVQLYRCRVDL